MTDSEELKELMAMAHPADALIAAFVDGFVDDEKRAAKIRAHLGECVRCRRIAQEFGWTEASVVVSGPWGQNGARRGAQVEEFELKLVAASETAEQDVQAAPAFVAMAQAANGVTTLGYLPGDPDRVYARDALEAQAILFDGTTHALGAADAAGLRVVEGLSRDALLIWVVDAEDDELPAPEVL